MSEVYRELVVFIASPGDCEPERQRVRSVADEVTQTLGQRLGVRVRVTGWEQVQPDLGRPQAMINPLIDECDLFVGLLGHKWGSSTGTHSSGFLEEFERVVERRGDSDTPQIALFFRTVPQERLEDPGPQLKAVLDFQRRLRDRHVALYQQFDGPDDLGSLLWRFLADHIVRIGTSEVHRQVDVQSADEPSIPAGKETASPRGAELDDARRQVSAATDAVTSVVRGVQPDSPIDNDRLLLVALALNSDGGHIPAHVANRLFGRRQELALSPTEASLWLRTVLADIGRNRNRAGRVMPGWALVSLDQEGIRDLALNDEADIASGVFRTLLRLNRRPDPLWDFDASTTPGVAATWAASLRRTGVSLAATEYLAALATAHDVPLIRAILEIENAEPVTELQALLQGDMMPMARSLADSLSSPLWKSTMISRAMPDGADDSVKLLAVGEKIPVDVRTAAYLELEQRGLVDSEVVESMLRDPQTAEALLVSALDSTSPTSTETISSVLDGLPSKPLHGSEITARITAASSSTDELLSELDGAELGLDAWEALGWKRDPALVERARLVFDTDAAPIIKSPLLSEALDDGVLSYVRGRSRLAALRILTAQQPLPDEDRERVHNELDLDDWYTRGETLAMLASIARPADFSEVIPRLSQTYGADSERVVDELLGVGGTDAARLLIRDGEATAALPSIRVLGADVDVPNDELIELLHAPSGEIRIAAVDQLVQRLSMRDLANLMQDYPEQRNSYYYNVVAELDWLLHRKPLSDH